jgi:hypothetical protein
MARRVHIAILFLSVLGAGATAWLALEPAPPAQFSVYEPQDAGCSNPDPVVAVADIRWRGGA